MDQNNSEKASDIVSNFYKILNSTVVDLPMAIAMLDSLTKSKNFAKAFVNSDYFKVFLDRMNDKSAIEDLTTFEDNAKVLQNVCKVL